MISIMRAFAEGKKIECRRYVSDNWYITKVPCWDWSSFDYRVKPEHPKKKLVPYESAEEFLQAQKEHGFYVRPRNYSILYLNPVSVCIDGIMFDEHAQSPNKSSYAELANCYMWCDETPCGKEVEE